MTAFKHDGYFIYKEHTLGYLYQYPSGNKYLGVLHGSILRGSPHHWMNGPIIVSDKELRPATIADFDTYRVCLPPDFVVN